MPDIETLDILAINCNTEDMQISDEQISKIQEDGWCCTSEPQMFDVQLQCYTESIHIVILIQC